MLKDPEQRYRAVAARDSRFDGQFILAVRTTGIYCRPSCPASTPKRRNVEFFATAAAAQIAGYRACRRCLPDAVPGSPEWNLRADLAGRAMRLISDGVVERDGVTGLARRLGYSERHLTRVLTTELGAGPLALARAHRAHSARLLIETTSLSVADIAFAAGFASVRQFNDTIRAVFATTPTQLRIAAKRSPRVPVPAPGRVTLRLAVREPFDADGVLAFLAARSVSGVEVAEQGCYARTLRLANGPATASVRPATGHLECTLRLTDMRDLGSAVSRLRRLLDLDADPAAIDEVLGADPDLAPSVAMTPGIRVPGSVDGAETVVRALLGQQVTVAAARTAARRLADALGERLGNPDGDLTTLFPTAAAIADHGHEVLTGPARRIETIRTVCAAIADGDLDLHVGADAETLRTKLTSFTGIGPWTAGYVTMRLLGDPDVLLLQDIALRTGAGRLGLPSTVDALSERGRAWRPWRSYAGMHLWRAAAKPIERTP
ncbi:Methylated-DNA--protein-cysteine methyltransferase [Alloactinosynnema sp. L-07]|uniref:AlkA N-terminal domain-containing protein n=1 Tax=Alloactinosynnema sp. L-07 TaxID=1653480 RepID=UPI00065EFFCA|nr:AlkA N-terminal domain-containing protein [Alloactinosynnema sp. L-07]CRK61628.1 Methylated-DNA--protein-cysteine methyltransferase [Alloactinosynnema sp. L-07]